MYYTYIYYDPSRDNEPIYVGKGKNERAWSHLKRQGMHPFLQRLQLMKKNNVLPNIGFYSGLDEDLALLIEVELIAKLGRKNLGKGPLLNLTDGGDGVSGRRFSMSTETKLKISIKNTGKVRTEAARLNISKSGKGRIPPNKGRPMSESQKRLLRQINLGKVRDEDVKQRIRNTLTGVSHEKTTCNICGKLVGIRSVNRYHNNNCKFTNLL